MDDIAAKRRFHSDVRSTSSSPPVGAGRVSCPQSGASVSASVWDGQSLPLGENGAESVSNDFNQEMIGSSDELSMELVEATNFKGLDRMEARNDVSANSSAAGASDIDIDRDSPSATNSANVSHLVNVLLAQNDDEPAKELYTSASKSRFAL